MPEIDNTIALKVQSPNAMTSIGSMLDMAGKSQQIQQGGVELERSGIHLQRERQANQERIDVQNFMSKPDNFQTDGMVDLAKVNSAIPKIAPLTGAQYIDTLTRLSTAQTQAADASQKLTQDQRAIVAGPIGVLGRGGVKDPAVYLEELKNLKTQNPNNPQLHRLIDGYAALIGMHKPGDEIPKAAITASQSLLSPGAQQTLSPQAGLTSTGGALAETITQPAVGGNAPSISLTGRSEPLTLGPGQLETTEIGPDKQPYIVTRSPQGTIVGTRGLAGENGGTGGGGMPRFRPGDQEAVPVLEAERTQARNLLTSAPIAHTTNKGILDEIEKVISTGQTGGFMAKAASIAGAAGLNAPETAASAYDLIGKYTERNALEAAKAMGPGTNAGLEAAIKANGSAQYNPTALKKITKLNDAIVSGAEMYQPGLEKAIGAGGNRGVLAKREYDQAWAQNFDPLVMQLHNAQRSGDKAELQDLIKSIGGKDSAKAKELIQKARNLDRLSADGHL